MTRAERGQFSAPHQPSLANIITPEDQTSRNPVRKLSYSSNRDQLSFTTNFFICQGYPSLISHTMAESSSSQPPVPPSSQPPFSSQQAGSQQEPASSSATAGEPMTSSESTVVPKQEPDTTDVTLDASIEQDIDMNAGNNTDITGANNSDHMAAPGDTADDAMPTSVDALAPSAAPSKKETSLREFLGKMDEYAPIVSFKFFIVHTLAQFLLELGFLNSFGVNNYI